MKKYALIRLTGTVWSKKCVSLYIADFMCVMFQWPWEKCSIKASSQRWLNPGKTERVLQAPSLTNKRVSPPPSISLCSGLKQGSFSRRAEMSVQSPTAQMLDSPALSPRGVMSRHATSCSISVELQDTELMFQTSFQRSLEWKSGWHWTRFIWQQLVQVLQFGWAALV